LTFFNVKWGQDKKYPHQNNGDREQGKVWGWRAGDYSPTPPRVGVMPTLYLIFVVIM